MLVLGLSLAYAEMRLILAKVVYNFDISLAEESKGWIEKSKSYVVWEKPDLMINLTLAKR